MEMKVHITLEMDVDTDDYGYGSTQHGGTAADGFEIVQQAMDWVVAWPNMLEVTCDSGRHGERLLRTYDASAGEYVD